MHASSQHYFHTVWPIFVVSDFFGSVDNCSASWIQNEDGVVSIVVVTYGRKLYKTKFKI